mmetsp:Transcript_13117/g.32092  ORF Transcript_13117/g.32092 Transcript_13117/m.32092 type:complete len:207 (-) Transcript_13117:242-862(-)
MLGCERVAEMAVSIIAIFSRRSRPFMVGSSMDLTATVLPRHTALCTSPYVPLPSFSPSVSSCGSNRVRAAGAPAPWPALAPLCCPLAAAPPPACMERMSLCRSARGSGCSWVPAASLVFVVLVGVGAPGPEGLAVTPPCSTSCVELLPLLPALVASSAVLPWPLAAAARLRRHRRSQHTAMPSTAENNEIRGTSTATCHSSKPCSS